MKIGKQPKRMGKPSQKFLDKQKALGRVVDPFESSTPDFGPEDHVITGSMLGSLPPKPDTVRIFLDDERPCPEGWYLARNIYQFREFLDRDVDFRNKITELSLDWNLGIGQVDGEFACYLLSDRIREAAYEEEDFLPNLRRIYFHSSDRDAARKMGHIIHKLLEEPEIKRDIRLRLGLPT